MFSDIAIPKNNEAEFAEIASKLGLRKLYFLYSFDEYNQDDIKKKLDSINNKKINLKIGFLVNQKNISNAMQHSKLLAAKSSDKDRLFIEGKKIKLIYGFEELNKKDYIHQRASWLNHILCELAGKNNIFVGFSYSSLFNKSGTATSMLIGRMMQNIRLCRKYKVKTAIGAFSEKPFDLRAHHDVMSLFNLFGMDNKTIKDSMAFDM